MVIEDPATEHCHHTLELLISFDLSAARTEIGKFPFDHLEHGDVSRRPNTQVAQLGALNHLSRIHRCPANYLLQRYSESKKLRHYVGQADAYCEWRIRKQIRANGIGNKALLDRGHYPPQRKTPRGVAKIELYASRSRFGHIRIQLAILRQIGVAIGQAVSDNVTWTHFLEEEFAVTPGGEFSLGRHR